MSPPSTMSKSSLAEKSPYENINNSSTSSFSMLKTPQSPRTQIRTMLPSVLPEQRDNEQHQQHVSIILVTVYFTNILKKYSSKKKFSRENAGL